MNAYDDHVTLVDQPRRLPAADRPLTTKCTTRRYIGAAETAKLLGVTEKVLGQWRIWRHGLQPVPRPEGWLYDAERIEHLAAMPMPGRALAIWRIRD